MRERVRVSVSWKSEIKPVLHPAVLVWALTKPYETRVLLPHDPEQSLASFNLHLLLINWVDQSGQRLFSYVGGPPAQQLDGPLIEGPGLA